eukprot:Sspe_Gene.47163::Locus_23850_Transcript_1_1_Confidence_1.000_Length_1110::g.47163::m.47163
MQGWGGEKREVVVEYEVVVPWGAAQHVGTKVREGGFALPSVDKAWRAIAASTAAPRTHRVCVGEDPLPLLAGPPGERDSTPSPSSDSSSSSVCELDAELPLVYRDGPPSPALPIVPLTEMTSPPFNTLWEGLGPDTQPMVVYASAARRLGTRAWEESLWGVVVSAEGVLYLIDKWGHVARVVYVEHIEKVEVGEDRWTIVWCPQWGDLALAPTTPLYPVLSALRNGELEYQASATPSAFPKLRKGIHPPRVPPLPVRRVPRPPPEPPAPPRGVEGGVKGGEPPDTPVHRTLTTPTCDPTPRSLAPPKYTSFVVPGVRTPLHLGPSEPVFAWEQPRGAEGEGAQKG